VIGATGDGTGYGDVTTVTAGEKLHLPAPFNLTLDTSSLPLPA